jgi:hypothetical protein
VVIRIPAILLILLTAAAPAMGEEPRVIRLSEPVVVTDNYEIFGSPVEPGETQRLADVIADEEDYVGREVRVEATVAKVCQKKGCFFIAQDGESVARITFVDYSFFVPTDSGGKAVTIVGTFDRKTLSEGQAKHYVEDAGGDPSRVSGPRSEYSIVATSVIVPRS